MKREDAIAFLQWLNSVGDYIPPMHFRVGHNSAVGQILIAVANGKVSCAISDCAATEAE